MSRKKRIAIIAIVTVAIVGAGSAAFAYWTSTGTGTGSATTGASVDFVVTSSTPTGGPLAPNGPTENAAFSVKNPGTGDLSLAGVTVAVANSDGSAWTTVAGCSAADYTVTIDSGLTLGVIAAGNSVSGSATITMVETGLDQDACQNVSVPLYFVAS